MCWLCLAPAAAPLVKTMCSSPKGKAALIALAPVLLLGAALLMGAVQWEDVAKKASCVMECDCARSYAIGFGLVWLLAISSALKSGPAPLPKDAVVPPPVPEIVDAKGKVAAKAA